MKYYKDNQNNVFAYEADGSQDHLIGDKIQLTDAELQLHLTLPKSQAQLEAEASQARDAAMLAGFDYKGHQVSVTKDDGDGLVQVKMGFELDPSDTIIHFRNGTHLPMSVTEFATFAPLFIAERKKFFGGA